MDRMNVEKTIKGTVNGAAEKLADKMPADFEQRFQDLRKYSREGFERGEEIVRKHPFYSLLGAVLVGAVLGRIFRRAM